MDETMPIPVTTTRRIIEVSSFPPELMMSGLQIDQPGQFRKTPP
jgi:hypothetical protein